jgi:Domain of unknown function (DUF4760)
MGLTTQVWNRKRASEEIRTSFLLAIATIYASNVQLTFLGGLMFDGVTALHISVAAIAISAVVATGLAIFNWHWGSGVARRKATHDYISQKIWDRDYIRAKSLFIAARNAEGGNALVEQAKQHLKDPHPEDEKMSTGAAIRLIMNDYEAMFISIETKVLDETYIREWQNSVIIFDYVKTKPYVEWARLVTGNKKLYVKFQKNAERWEKTPLDVK